ncbi:MAG: AraC family transcriptional regulator, partial [Chloroflexota bacterium]
VDAMMSFGDKMMMAKTPRRPIAGGTYYGIHPERYNYWRVGYGSREWFPLDFWVERAGEFHGKPNYKTGDFHWTHSTQLFYHLAGESVFEYEGRRVAVTPGNIFIIPPHRQFTYQGRGVKYHWLGVTGAWPAILGHDGHIRYLAIGEDADIVSKFIEIREVLILQKPGYPIKAIGILYELAARIEELTCGSADARSTYPEAVRNAMTYLAENYAEPFNAAATAAAVNVSQSHLRGLFEKWLGESPREFHTRSRINQASRLLREQRLSISEVAGEVGYDDVHHFSRVFKRLTGVSPRQFFRGRL